MNSLPAWDSPEWETLIEGVMDESEPLAVALGWAQADDLLREAPADWYGWTISWANVTAAQAAVTSAKCSIPMPEDWPSWSEKTHALHYSGETLAAIALERGLLPAFPPKWQGWFALADASGTPIAFLAAKTQPRYLEEFRGDWSGWLMRDASGETLAHAWIRRGRRLPGEKYFRGWVARSEDGLTVAHLAATKGTLPEFPSGHGLWNVRDSDGETLRDLVHPDSELSD
jgi:hypothetical protein